MSFRPPITQIRNWAFIGLACAALFSGCATTDGGDPMARSDDGDIPWNQPQPWEGTIPMPTPGGGGF